MDDRAPEGAGTDGANGAASSGGAVQYADEQQAVGGCVSRGRRKEKAPRGRAELVEETKRRRMESGVVKCQQR